MARMERKTTGIVAYITVLGWLIAYVAGDKEGAQFHLNQSLVVHLAFLILAILSRIPIIGWFMWIFEIAVFVCAVLGLVYAVQDQDKEVPLLGIVKILK